MPPIPPITQFLMLACTAIFCLQQLVSLGHWLLLFPIRSGLFLPWQPLTYAFLHISPIHLFFNMLALWMFGGDLELLWGRKRYMAFLAMGAVFGALAYLLMTVFTGPASPLIGFSGAIYALLMAAAMLFPNRVIMPLFPPIPMKMRTAVIAFGAIALLFAWGDASALAHLGGLLGGWLTMRYWRGQPPFGKRRR